VTFIKQVFPKLYNPLRPICSIPRGALSAMFGGSPMIAPLAIREDEEQDDEEELEAAKAELERESRGTGDWDIGGEMGEAIGDASRES